MDYEHGLILKKILKYRIPSNPVVSAEVRLGMIRGVAPFEKTVAMDPSDVGGSGGPC